MIEKFFEVVVTLRTNPSSNETFQTAKRLEELGLDVFAIYDNTSSIYGKCTPTIMGVLMADSSVKSIERNEFI